MKIKTTTSKKTVIEHQRSIIIKEAQYHGSLNWLWGQLQKECVTVLKTIINSNEDVLTASTMKKLSPIIPRPYQLMNKANEDTRRISLLTDMESKKKTSARILFPCWGGTKKRHKVPCEINLLWRTRLLEEDYLKPTGNELRDTEEHNHDIEFTEVRKRKLHTSTEILALRQLSSRRYHKLPPHHSIAEIVRLVLERRLITCIYNLNYYPN